MVRIDCLRLSFLCLLLQCRLPATEILVTFEGDVERSGVPGISRGQPASGRIIYDNAALDVGGADHFRIYEAVLLFELRIGTTEYAMTGGPGELNIYDGSPNYMSFKSPDGGVSGPAALGVPPFSLQLSLFPGTSGLIPGLALGSVATQYDLSDFPNPLDVPESALFFPHPTGGYYGVGILLEKLEAKPFIRSSTSALHFIRLEDIVAGGDGSGNAPPGNTGIDPRTGTFTTTGFEGVLSPSPGDPIPVPVTGSPFIDSVFILRGRVPTAGDGCNGCYLQYTTQSSVLFLVDDSEESPFAWNFILKDRVGGVSAPGIRVGGFDHFTSSIGLHASQGITFDLDDLRERHGAEAVGCFSAFWGLDDCASGLVRLYAMVSNDVQGVTDIRNVVFGPGQGGPVNISIPPGAQYLTLASASFNGNINCDHATIARPIISPVFCPQISDGWIWKFVPSRVAPAGESVLVEGEALFDGYSIRVGGVDLLDQVYLSDQSRSAVTPPLSPGFYDAEIVFNGTIIQRLPRAIEVAPPPVITAVSPNQALADRRTLARFQGQNLRRDMEVVVVNSAVGSESLLHQEFLSPQLITGYIPPVDPFNAISGTNVFLFDQGRLYEFPVLILYVDIGIEKVEPNLVPTVGGAVVTLSGLGFGPETSFRLGSSPLLDVQVIDSGLVRAKTPPLPAGVHAAQLLIDGQVLNTLPEAVQAVTPTVPHITGVTPSAVSTRGGDLVTVTTDAWHGGATPRVGGVALTNIDATQVTLVRGEAPRLATGFHAVELVGADGTVLSRLEAAIQAVDPPGISITSVAPFEVATGGGTPVTFTGTGFEPGLVPRFGGLPLTKVEIVDGQHLSGLSPPLEEGVHFASLTEGNAERARMPDAVHALPILLSAPPVVGRPAAQRFAAGGDRIGIAAANMPAQAVLRVGGVAVTAVAPSNPCGLIGGGGGGGIAGDGQHAVFEGIVPDLPPGRYAVDFYLPGQGVLATLDEAVEVVASDAPPAASHVVSADVLPDGSTRLHIFGSGFSAATRFVLGGKPMTDVTVVSSRLAVGHAPALGPAEGPGPRTLELIDPRGGSSLASAVVYVGPGVRFVRGDPNQDGSVNISDAVAILGYLFLGTPSSFDCLEAADVDDGGDVDITDPIRLLGHLFLGDPAPPAPFPACGVDPAVPPQGCESFALCGGAGGSAGRGRGGIAAGLRSNVFVLGETRTEPGAPILRDLSPVANEVVLDDPPGGLDLQPGDIISGYVPVTSAAIHEGVAFLLKIEGERPRSCLATAPGDRTYQASPAPLAEVFTDAEIELEMPGSAPDMRLSPELVTASGNTLCDLAEAGGGAGGGAEGAGDEGGGGAVFDPLIDVTLPGMEVFGWEDGPNYVHAGFHRLRILYATSQASLGVGISGLKVTGVSFFSGILLDSELVVYVDSHFEEHIRKEKKVLSLRKDHVVVLLGVPIHFAATGDLIAGVDLDAQVNLYASAGARARFTAGVGMRFDGNTIHDLSGLSPPELEEVPNAQELNLSGSLAVKGYLRPITHLRAGILFRGVTADLGMESEAFVRFHAAGETDPVPCFDWGVDAGMRMTLIPEIQLFGKDLFDESIGLFDEEELNLIGGRYGCKKPPVPRVSYYVVPLGDDRYEVHLDASASYDPDGGPLRFRWDFDADGQCDRATLGDPRTTAELEHVCPPFDVRPFDICERGRNMILRVTDDEDVSAEHKFRIVLR